METNLRERVVFKLMEKSVRVTTTLREADVLAALIHLLKILDAEVFQAWWDKACEDETSYEDVSEYFHKTMRQRAFYEKDGDLEYGYKKGKVFTNIGGHLDMALWNLLCATPEFFEIMREVYNEQS